MPRARNKEDLLKFAAENYAKLMEMISNMTENQMNTPFDFSGDASKKEAHWGRDKNVRDVLIHLYEWHQLMIQFVHNNEKSEIVRPFLPAEYSWKTYGAMNVMFWNRHQNTSLEAAKELLAQSHTKVLSLAEQFTNEELFTKKYFPWTGTSDLGSYFVSTTASHYDWAIKKIKLHCKKVA
ncbi:MAG: ClbS/DfsB family four-helix bundle protein [Bacteroidales bacterium]|nr:ClbS/DfsB family four-helix bundle protein [Bacteroidales bacterium]MCR4799955.1 ClbS/DfsB family four-helix bundle protein [Bacteroidales bacterium]